MAFFSNGAVNRVNLHYAIRAFAQAGAGVFFLAFLLQAGVSAPQALLAQAGIFAARFAIRPVVLPIAKRWGLKPLVIAGTLLLATAFPVLSLVEGVGGALVAVCLLWAAGEAFYWTAYHAYFSVLGDAEHRGHQVSAREAIAAGIGIVAPLAGAAALAAFGPGVMLAAAGVVQASAVLPLWTAPTVAIRPRASGTLAAALPGMALQITSGWSAGWTYFLWAIVLFTTLSNDMTAFGGAMALAALAGAVIGMVLGRHIDGGRAMRSTLIAFGFASLVVALRAASEGAPILAVTANALGAVATLMQTPSMGAMIYNLTKTAPCPLRFQIATEGSFDIGVFCACLIAAALLSAGAPLSLPILLSLPAQAIMAIVLLGYFRKRDVT
jgi:hypothetical protein